MDLSSLVEVKKSPQVADFKPGDTVRVSTRVAEGDRVRSQVFEGVVIRMRRQGTSSNFTVRRVSSGVGVERTFPIYSPLLEAVAVVRRGRVRRAKLYYLRGRVGRAARIKEERRPESQR
ncbi:MAG: 50S ribosomal protein L19 [Dehalococcoidia bacterium]